jgi:hypothetical protein
MDKEAVMEILHKTTKSVHNQYYDDINSLAQPYYDYIIATKTIEFEKVPTVNEHITNYSCFTFPTTNEDESFKNKGIRNIRVEGDFSEVILQVGGQVVDITCNTFKKSAQEPYATLLRFVDPKVCLPFLLHHNIKILCHSKSKCKITYDLVSINYGNHINNVFYYIFDTKYYIGVDAITKDSKLTSNNEYKMKLTFNQPITKIMVDISNPVESIVFQPQPNMPEYSLHLTKVNDIRWELDFGKNYVNFSKLNKPILLIKTTNNEMTHVFAFGVSLHAAKSAHGMFGLVFSNEGQP